MAFEIQPPLDKHARQAPGPLDLVKALTKFFRNEREALSSNTSVEHGEHRVEAIEVQAFDGQLKRSGLDLRLHEDPPHCSRTDLATSSCDPA